MKKAALIAVGGALVAGTASAQVQNSGVSFTPGVYAVTNSSAQIFETFNEYASSTNGTPFPSGSVISSNLSGTATETTTGSTLLFPGSSSAVGKGVNPDPTNPTLPGQTDNYVAVGGNGPAGTLSVAFSAAQQYFSFSFGSLDNYNYVILGFANGLYETFSGNQIITGNGGVSTSAPATPAPPANPASTATTGRVAYNAQGGSGITSVTFGSSQAAFEIDDLAAATPEPATWAMMIMGFGLAGAALRMRRRKSTIAFA